MNDFDKKLFIEYTRVCDREEYLRQMLEILPKGTIQKKRIKEKDYFYLQYRYGNKIKSVYIKKSDTEETIRKVQQRKEADAEIKLIRKQRKTMEEMMSMDLINLITIRDAVRKIVVHYPEITRMAVFGSRAESTYKDNSDVDLIFETKEPISLMKQNEIRIQLEDELGLDVDLVHGPLKEGNFLEIGTEVEVYAA